MDRSPLINEALEQQNEELRRALDGREAKRPLRA